MKKKKKRKRTVCQIQIIEEEEVVNLHYYEGHKFSFYHDTRGEPKDILPLFWKLWERLNEIDGYYWFVRTAGRASSFLCSLNPYHITPLDYHELEHKEVDYLYKLYVCPVGKEKPWKVEIFMNHRNKLSDLQCVRFDYRTDEDGEIIIRNTHLLRLQRRIKLSSLVTNEGELRRKYCNTV